LVIATAFRNAGYNVHNIKTMETQHLYISLDIQHELNQAFDKPQRKGQNETETYLLAIMLFSLLSLFHM
jgi:hypothetical protein